MKALRFILVVVFMFTMFVSPVQAQESGHYGFVPMVTQADPNVPLVVQAQHAFEKLLPALLAGQHSGTILEFEPDLAAGIVKIKYAASADMSTLGTAQVSNNIHAAVAMVPHPKVVKSEGGSAFSPTFRPYLYSSCFEVIDVNINSYVVASLRDKTGAVVANYTGIADVSGYLYDCFDYAGAYTNILPGYKVTYKVYTTAGGGLLGTYTTIAPTVNFTTVNKTTSVVGGVGPVGKAYSIFWYHDNLNAANSTLIVNKTGTIPATAKWSVDFGVIKFRGGDHFNMYVTQTANFVFYRSWFVPYIYCQLGSNFCSIYGVPFQAATLSITHAGVVHTFNGKFTRGGWFDIELLDAAGAPIFLTPGDKISGTGIPVYALPALTIVPNFTTDVVTGKAPASRYFSVWVKDVQNQQWYSVWAHTDALGNYAASFSGTFDLVSGAVLTYEVDYVDPATGNETDKYMAVGP